MARKEARGRRVVPRKSEALDSRLRGNDQGGRGAPGLGEARGDSTAQLAFATMKSTAALTSSSDSCVAPPFGGIAPFWPV